MTCSTIPLHSLRLTCTSQRESPRPLPRMAQGSRGSARGPPLSLGPFSLCTNQINCPACHASRSTASEAAPPGRRTARTDAGTSATTSSLTAPSAPHGGTTAHGARFPPPSSEGHGAPDRRSTHGGRWRRPPPTRLSSRVSEPLSSTDDSTCPRFTPQCCHTHPSQLVPNLS